MTRAELGAAWNRFFHAEQPVVALGLFRILFAYCLWREVDTTGRKSLFAIDTGFHLPYVDWVFPVSADTFALLQQLQYPLIALVGLGLLFRPAAALLLGLQGWVFFSDQLNFRNHPYFFLLVLLLLLLSPAGEALSLGGLVRARRRREPLGTALLGPELPFTMQRLIQLQVVLVYVYAALHKINPGYLGDGFAGIAMNKLFKGSSEESLERWLSPESIERLRGIVLDPDVLLWLAGSSVALELLLPVALLWRKTRPAAIVVGVAFHLTLAFVMGIRTFSYAMCASYLLFLDPQTLPKLYRRFTA